MANSVFLDTSGWIALLHSKDVNHTVATDAWLKLGLQGCDIVLTDWIIAETGNGLARTRIRHLFADAVDQIGTSPKVDIVVVDHALISQAVSMFRRHADKSWGLVDCCSFVVMRERGITDAFTSDVHFEQAGFKRLLPGR